MNFRNSFLFILFIVLAFVVNAQELPPIKVFTPQTYGADDQNWAISQGKKDEIYFANNKGLLTYNGARWQLYPSPNESIFRSVSVINDKIYTGCYMDFGYWVQNEFGLLVYTSLKDKVKVDLIEDEEFWGIIEVENWVLFQSFDRIYMYNTLNDDFKIINSNTRINKIFKVQDTIYFQKIGEGLFKIENGNAVLVSSHKAFTALEIVNIYQNDTHLLIQTKASGFYIYKNNAIEKWNIEANELLSKISVYSSKKLKDGSYVLGTISNGIIQLSPNGEVLLSVNQQNGLSNTTVLSILEDQNGNVWLGLDNGVNVLNLNSPYRVYKDNRGVLGTTYATAKTKSHLYLGTNQGLFYKKNNSQDPFKPVKKTEGQVWSLKLFKGVLFCGHDKGTFTITNGEATLISNIKGAWCIKEIPNAPHLLLQGNYKGISVLEKNSENQWGLKHRIDGFEMSSRYLEVLSPTEVLVSHEYKGVFYIKLNEDYTKVIKFSKAPIEKGFNSSIVTYNGNVLYVYKDGVFSYNYASKRFKKDSLLSTVFSNHNYVSGKLINDDNGNKLWGFTNNQIIYIEPGKITQAPKTTKITLPVQVRKSKSGYEDILHLEDEKYLIGTKEGYLIVDLDKLTENVYTIYLNSVSYDALRKQKVLLQTDQDVQLSNAENNVHFSYSVADFNKFYPSLYQYRLVGIYNDWSNWSETSNISFENLPSGDYTFEARAKVGSHLSKNTISFSFSIDKPWYQQPWAIGVYILSFLIIAFLIHYFNTQYYKKQKQQLLDKKQRELEVSKLENQRKIIQFKNKNLNQDIENKNRELGISTMSLIKKNELLNSIKKEISNAKQLGDLKFVVKLINKNLNTSDDWKLFEEAFNNADKDFIKKIKSKHPALTSNDLRLCAYLRLNLASKEIAPLLNISPKSVEVKRYRLRKKMNLPHKTSLTNYILEI